MNRMEWEKGDQYRVVQGDNYKKNIISLDMLANLNINH